MIVRHLFTFILIAITLSSCYKKGCTDQSALNYDKQANTGEPCWECDYNGTIYFYLNAVTRDTLIAHEVTSLNIHVENAYLGSFPINSSVDYPNDCAANPMKINFDAGRICYVSYIQKWYVITDQNGDTLWHYFNLLSPNSCSGTELHF